MKVCRLCDKPITSHLEHVKKVHPEVYMASMRQIFDFYTRTSQQLDRFGGYLECQRCATRRELGDTAAHLQFGWPKCCGYTMSWVTAAQALSSAESTGSTTDTKPSLKSNTGEKDGIHRS